MKQGTVDQYTTIEFKEIIFMILLVLDFITGNLEIPFEEFINVTSDPMYYSILTAGLIKNILKKITKQDKDRFRKVFKLVESYDI